MFYLYRDSLMLKNWLNGYLQYYNIKKLECEELKFPENLGILLYYNIILMLNINVAWYKVFQQYLWLIYILF